MTQEQDEALSSYYDLLEEHEMMAMTPLSPHFGPDILEGAGQPQAHATQPDNHTTIDGPVSPRGAPTYSYPADLSLARGARHLPISTTAPSLAGTPLADAPATVAPGASSYPSRLAGPYGFQSTLDWSSSASNPLYNRDSDSGSHSASNLFDFTFGPQNTQPPTASTSYSDFVAPDSLHTPQQPNFDFGYPTSSWNETSDGSNPLALTNPISADDSVDAEALPIFGSPAAKESSSSISPRHKRARKSTSSASAREVAISPGASTTHSHASMASISSSKTADSAGSAAVGSNSGKNKSKLRSASRTSKNTHQKPAETAEERKTRASHNLVEKQYRNRLNAQFESLLDVLPHAAHAEGDDGESEDQDLERRVSKAEVLDMARRHIKQLERDRDQLEQERDELLGNMERLQETYAHNIAPGMGMGSIHPGPSTNPGGGYDGYGEANVPDEGSGA